MNILRKLFGGKRLQAKADDYPMEKFQNRSIGFNFQYPKGWEKEFREGALVITPANANTSYLAITMIASNNEDFSKSPAKECESFITHQCTNFLDYRLLWKRPFKLSSEHTAIEYSFDFTDPHGPFRSIALVAARRDNLAWLFSLDVSGLRPDVQSSEVTFHKIVRSLSL
jgi:hypothetical protein